MGRSCRRIGLVAPPRKCSGLSLRGLCPMRAAAASADRGLGIRESNLDSEAFQARVDRGEREASRPVSGPNRRGCDERTRSYGRALDLLEVATDVWVAVSGYWPALDGWLLARPRGSRPA